MKLTIAELVAILAMDSTKFREGMKVAETASLKMARNLEKIGKRATKYVTLPLLAAGTASVKMAMDFETQITALYTIMDEATYKSRDWGQEVINLSKKMGESTGTLADGLYYLVGSGIDAADAMGVLEIAAKSAKAGFTDTATAVAGLAAILNSYSLDASEAERVSDVMFATVNFGIITYEELAHSIGRVLPVAAAANVPIEELGAALTVLTLGGLDANMAITALMGTILSFLRPTPQAAEIAEELGFNMSATALATDGLYGTLKKLTEVLGLTDESIEELNESTMTEAELQKVLAERAGTTTEKIASMFTNVRALIGVLSLVKGGGVEFDKQMKNMGETAGTLDTAFKKVAETTKFQFDIALSSLKATSIEVGTKLLPIATKLFKVIGGLAGKFGDLSDASQSAIISLAGITAAIGPLLYFGAKTYLLIAKLRTVLGAAKLATLGFTGAAVGLSAVLAGVVYLNIKQGQEMLDKYNVTIDGVTMSWREYRDVLEDKGGVLAEIITLEKKLEDILFGRKETVGELSVEIEEYIEKIMGWQFANSELIIILDELTAAQKGGVISIIQYEKALQYLIETEGTFKGTTEELLEQAKYLGRDFDLVAMAADKISKAAEEGVQPLDEFGNEIEDVGGQAEESGKSINELVGFIFRLYNLSQATTESELRYKDALWKVEELTRKGITSGEKYEAAIRGLQDAKESHMAIIVEEIKYGDKLIGEQEKLVNEYLKLSKTAIEAGETTLTVWWENTREMGLVSEEIGQYLIDMGSEAVRNGEITREQFNEMLFDFNILGEGIDKEIVTKIIPSYDKMYRKGGELEDQVIEPEIYIRDKPAIDAIHRVDRNLRALDGKSATVGINIIETRTVKERLEKFMGSMGGIIRGDKGAIIGIPKADYGYVVPQTGREVPVIAHEGEVLLNTSQQGNIAKWIMNKATTRPGDIRGIGNIQNIFKIATLIVREEADVDKVAEVLFEKQKSEQRGAGYK